MTFMRKILDALTIESPKAMTDSADVDYPSENSSPTKEPIKGSIINNTGKSISYPKVTDAFYGNVIVLPSQEISKKAMIT